MLRWLGINYLGQHGDRPLDITQNNLIESKQPDETIKEVEQLRNLLLEQPGHNGVLIEAISRIRERY